MKDKTLLELAQELEFDTEEEYFEYIVLSLINGNRFQMVKLYKAMDERNRHYFINHYLDRSNGIDTLTINEIKNYIINNL